MLSTGGGSGDSIREFCGGGLSGGGRVTLLENGFSSSTESSRDGRVVWLLLVGLVVWLLLEGRVVWLLLEGRVEVGGCLLNEEGGGFLADVLVGAFTLVFVMFPAREVLVL